MEKTNEVAKKIQKTQCYVQEERESKNIGRETLDVSPQAPAHNFKVNLLHIK